VCTIRDPRGAEGSTILHSSSMPCRQVKADLGAGVSARSKRSCGDWSPDRADKVLGQLVPIFESSDDDVWSTRGYLSMSFAFAYLDPCQEAD
jgi:hypothetical protein